MERKTILIKRSLVLLIKQERPRKRVCITREMTFFPAKFNYMSFISSCSRWSIGMRTAYVARVTVTFHCNAAAAARHGMQQQIAGRQKSMPHWLLNLNVST